MDQPHRSFTLVLKSREFPLPFQFKKMVEINSDLFEILVLNENHQYVIRSDVTVEILTAFINYLVNDEVPDINIHNFNEFSLLSHEFQIPIVKNKITCTPYGIIKYFLLQNNGNLEDEIEVTSSSVYSNGREPVKGISIDDLSPSFASANEENAWL